MRRFTEKQLKEAARIERDQWQPHMQPTAMAVIACFIHRVTTGRDLIADCSKNSEPPIDFQI